MSVIRNALSIYPALNYRKSQQSLLTSMARLSSGKKITQPGDASAEFGIAENFKYQIQGSEQAMLNIQNTQGMIDTSDSWLQATQDILRRMSELSISAVDGSKTDGDRANLDLEYQQLKKEIARIADEAQYNGIQIAGRDNILTFDRGEKTFRFSQIDGTQQYTLPNYVLSGLSSVNAVNYNFSSTNEYSLSEDGRYIFYIDSNDQLSRYEINTGLLLASGNVASVSAMALEVDNTGRLWYLTPISDTVSTVYSLKLQDINSWTSAQGSINAEAINNITSKDFKIYNDRIYYYSSTNNFTSRSILEVGDEKVLLHNSSLDTQINVSGIFAFDESGRFTVDEMEPGVLRVMNLKTSLWTQVDLGDSVDITNVALSSDSNEIVYTDANSKSIRLIKIATGDQPTVVNSSPFTIAESLSGFAGVSLDGGAHRSNFVVQNGPDYDQFSHVVGGDVRLYTLGLLDGNVKTIKAGSKSIELVADAINKVSLQRSKLGSEQSRLTYTYKALGEYSSNISAATSLITDVNFAEESAKLSVAQMANQINISLMQRSSQLSQVALQLLNR